MGRQRKGTATASETSPKAISTSCAVAAPMTGASACSDRQATSSTAGSSAAESSAETGGGASEWASGSQLWTGAQPTLAARPASSSRYATSVVSRVADEVESACQERASRPPPGTPAARMTMPSSATPRPSDVRIRYFQPASERPGLAAEPDQEGRGGGRPLDEQPGGAEVPGQAAPRAEPPRRRRASTKYVRSRSRSGTSELRTVARYAGETSTLASPTRPVTPTSSPAAASTAIRLSTEVVPGSPSATPARATARAAAGYAPVTATRVARRRGATATSAAISTGAAMTAQASASRLVTERS